MGIWATRKRAIKDARRLLLGLFAEHQLAIA